MQGLEQIAEPNMAASILSYGLGYEAVFIMCSMASLTGLAIYAFTYMKLCPTNPALADAS